MAWPDFIAEPPSFWMRWAEWVEIFIRGAYLHSVAERVDAV